MAKTTRDTRHPRLYDELLEKTRQFIDEADREISPKLHYAVDAAKDKIADLEEYTREEVEKIGEYLKRDLIDAARFSGDFGQWLKFETGLIEDRLLEAFSSMVDHTRLELNRIRDEADRYGEWRSGEVAGIGTLVCQECGETLRFSASSLIPPCPRCQGHRWRRAGAD